MSTEIFSFMKVGRLRYPSHHRTNVVRGNFGVEITRPEFGPDGLYQAAFTVRLPGSGKTIADWNAFLNTIRGGYDTFLFKDGVVENWYKSTTESCGTGTGSLTDFALDYKHVDSSTLQVFKDGVLQGSGYSLINNNSTPTIRFTSAPTLGVVITATYEYYIPVRFSEDPPQGGDFLGAGLHFSAEVEIVEDYSGARKV